MVLLCVAVCRRVWQSVIVHYNSARCCTSRVRVLQCVIVSCRVLQGDAVCCSVMQCVAGCCSVLQCVAVF